MLRPLRVAILNDFDVVIQGLAAILGDPVHGIELIAASTDLEALADLTLDVVLFDSFGRVDAGPYVSRVVLATAAPVLVFSWAPTSSASWGRRDVGCAGYLFKGSSAADLVVALRQVASGSQLSDGAATGRGIGAWPGQRVRLSARESEVMALIAAGLSNDDIAELLFISLNTVKTYIRSGYGKAGVSTRSQAILWALAHGFSSPALTVAPGLPVVAPPA